MGVRMCVYLYIIYIHYLCIYAEYHAGSEDYISVHTHYLCIYTRFVYTLCVHICNVCIHTACAYMLRVYTHYVCIYATCVYTLCVQRTTMGVRMRTVFTTSVFTTSVFTTRCVKALKSRLLYLYTCVGLYVCGV